MILYIYQNFNNYFNKKIKRFETLAEYGTPHFVQANVNFKPNDGVNTIATVGAKESYDGSGDYLIAVNDDNTINSRWFILDQSRNREGQFLVTVRRDLISDFYESVMNDSTIYLEKGWINNLSNPLLFNDEGFKPNQIKKSETLIKDKSKCKWLVGYVDKKAGDTKDEDTGVTTNMFWNGADMETDISGNIRVDLEVSSWNSWDLWPFVSGDWKVAENITISLTRFASPGYSYIQKVNKNGFVGIEAEDDGDVSKAAKANAKTWGSKVVAKYNELDDVLATTVNADMNYEQYQRLLALDGKIVYSTNPDDNPRYIKISAQTATPPISWINDASLYNITASNAPIAYETLQTIYDEVYVNIAEIHNYKANSPYARIKTSYTTISTAAYKNYHWGTSDSGHAHLTHEAYDMFAIPISTDEAGAVHIWDGSFNDEGNPNYGWTQADEQAGFIVAQHLIEKAGSGGYDLQLVPFAPLEDDLIERDAAGVVFRTDNLLQNFDYSIVYDDTNIAYTCIFWITRNSFSHAIEDVKIDNYTTVEELKAANQLDVYFLNSGDYSSSFEFSPARNRGVSRFIVDCTYKPYHPYIRVCPFFNPNGLYGQDWNDARGLICSGTNFSISRGTSAWETFERNNLNYENAWKREIAYMDTMHAYDRVNQIIGASTGALGAGVGVGIATASAGVGIGAGILSAGAGVADILISEQQYQLNRDNQVAARNENLANIKAQPNTLAATGANTKNNKIFPILTYYSCTDTERELFNLQLENYGLTVNCIVNKLSDYLNDDTTKSTYIKGQLIRLENINEDNHLVYEIAQELMRGIYLKGVNE